MTPFGGALASAAAASVAGALLWLAAGKTAEAYDALPTPLTRLAAVNETYKGSPSQRQVPTPGGLEMWLLVQAAQPSISAAGDNDGTVLALFVLSAPKTAEDELANEYGLELIERKNLSSLGMRIARYRVPAGTPLAMVVERLQADRRVARAQANLLYAPPAPVTVNPEVGSGKTATNPPEAPQQAKSPVSEGSVANRRTALRGTPVGKPQSAGVRKPLRIGGAPDVLTGGL